MIDGRWDRLHVFLVGCVGLRQGQSFKFEPDDVVVISVIHTKGAGKKRCFSKATVIVLTIGTKQGIGVDHFEELKVYPARGCNTDTRTSNREVLV